MATAADRAEAAYKAYEASNGRDQAALTDADDWEYIYQNRGE